MLNSYFTTPGSITYLGASNANGTVPLTLQLSDGLASNTRSYSSVISLTPVNDAPTISAGTPSATLIEAGGTNNGTAGVSTSSISITIADIDSVVAYDTAYLLAAGWSSSDAGLSYVKSGTYGNATLTLASGTVSYQLDDSRPVTNALQLGQTVTDAFTIQATDSQLTASTAATFTILGRNDAPSVSSSGSLSVPENSVGTVYTATASDPDSPSLSFSLAGADASLFTLTSNGALSFKTAPNYEAPSDSGSNNVYDLTIIASDGSLTGSKALAISVTDVNEAPTAVGFSTALISSLADDTSTASRIQLATILISDDALGSNSISLSGADASFFEVVGTGLYLRAGTSLNAAVKSTYQVTVSVQDASLSGSTPVSNGFVLTIVNNTPPTIQSVALTSATGAQNATLNAGDTLDASVSMSKPVVVVGTPSLNLDIGGQIVAAGYNSSLSSSSVLVFTTTIVAGQNDSDGVAIPANGLLNGSGGSIKDVYNNSAMLGYAAVAANPSFLVDTIAPVAPVLALASGLSGTLSRDQLTQASGSLLVLAESGSSLSLTVSSSGGGSFTRTLVASGTNQALVITTTEASALSDGTLTVSASTTDPAGNSSSAATPLVFSYEAVSVVPIGSVSVSVSQSGSETGPTATRFLVTRSGDLSNAASISYGLSGSAQVGVNYSYATGSNYASQGYGTLSFAAGSDTASIDLPTLDNLVLDPNRTITVQLQASSLYQVDVATATATISDNEVPAAVPVVSIASASFSEGDSPDLTAGSIIVNLDRPTTASVNVNYSFRGGTATPGNDYTATAGSLYFSPGVQSLTIPFTTIGDITIEPDETFLVDLTLPDSNAVFAGAATSISGTVTIVNDDPNLGINYTGSGTITGTTRNDTLTGGVLADVIQGLAGDDRIEGKSAADVLSGGTGATDLSILTSPILPSRPMIPSRISHPPASRIASLSAACPVRSTALD